MIRKSRKAKSRIIMGLVAAATFLLAEVGFGLDQISLTGSRIA